jgi:cyclopropane fatty-acyl-phospholipid synthase-like methyltransferase
MSILQITTTNPHLSWILRKNPASGMLITELRQGMIFSWYSNDTTYNAYFKDAPDEVSYKKDQDEQFEYLNTSRYNAALSIVNMITTLFDHVVKEQQEHDDKDQFDHTIQINFMYLRSQRYVALFQQHFQKCSLEVEKKANKNYRLTFTSRESLQDLLSIVMLFTMFYAIINDDDIYINQDIVKKYLSIVERVDPPYFIRYLFKLRFFPSYKLFEQYKDTLERSDLYPIQLTAGTNHQNRRDTIASHLDFAHSIIDIGCGEGFYAMPFSGKIADHQYIAIDTDEEMREIVEGKAKKREKENVSVFPSFEEFVSSSPPLDQGYDIIMTEVIEHMPMKEVEELIRQVLTFPAVHSFIITTPNKDFNQYYFDDEDEIRHQEHQFEMTKQEFADWIAKMIDSQKYAHEIIAIGDSVNGTTPTIGAVIRVRSH